MLQRVLLAAVLVSLASALGAARALACTCRPDVFSRSEPRSGAIAVPLNSAVVVEGFLIASTLTWTDADGAAVEFELNQGPQPGCPGTWADLVPKTALAPNTRYTIRAESSATAGEVDSFSFTTGDELLADEQPLPPQASASMVLDAPAAMCGGGTVFGCVAIEDPQDVELIVRKGDTILLRATHYLRSDTSFAVSEVPDCIELRRRSATGKRSEPLSICGDALGIRPFRDSDARQQVVQCKAGVIGGDSSDQASAGAGGAPVTDVSMSQAGAPGAEDASAGAGGERAAAAEASPDSSGCSAAGDHRDSGAGALALLLLMAAYVRRRSRSC